MINSPSEPKLKPEIITLHRYFIWADRMRVHFDATLKSVNPKTFSPVAKDEKDIEVFLYMSLWYGMFYVLIEGWQRLKLKDKKIDKLLKSNNVSLLKLYRNGVFHFQKKYYDKRFIKLMKEGQNIANWIRELRDEFSRWFLTFYEHR